MYTTNCKICGGMVSGTRFHYGCLVDEAYNAIVRGDKFTSTQRCRYYAGGVDIVELRQIVKEDMAAIKERDEKNDKKAESRSRRAEKVRGIEPDACMV